MRLPLSIGRVAAAAACVLLGVRANATPLTAFSTDVDGHLTAASGAVQVFTTVATTEPARGLVKQPVDESLAVDTLPANLLITDIPEPATLSLVGLGLACLVRRSRSRRRSVAGRTDEDVHPRGAVERVA